MPHRLAPEVEAELLDIWHYIAVEGGGTEIADRFIDSTTYRFFLLASFPKWAVGAMRIYGPDCAPFRWASMSIIYRI